MVLGLCRGGRTIFLLVYPASLASFRSAFLLLHSCPGVVALQLVALAPWSLDRVAAAVPAHSVRPDDYRSCCHILIDGVFASFSPSRTSTSVDCSDIRFLFCITDDEHTHTHTHTQSESSSVANVCNDLLVVYE